MSAQLELAEASQRLRRRPGRPRTRLNPGHVAVTSHSQVIDIARPIARPLAQETDVPARLLGVRGAAAYMSLSVWTVRYLIRAGQLRVVRVPGVSRVLVDRHDIDRLVEEWKVTASSL
jgi:excisionase family DNA binding protein